MSNEATPTRYRVVVEHDWRAWAEHGTADTLDDLAALIEQLRYEDNPDTFVCRNWTIIDQPIDEWVASWTKP